MTSPDDRFERAFEVLRQRHDHAEAQHPDGHPDVLAACRHLAQFCLAHGRLVRARGYFELALPMARRLLGPDHADTIELVGDLGRVCADLGEPGDAEGHLREYLAAVANLHGGASVATVVPRDDLAEALLRTGRPGEALALLRENVALCEAAPDAAGLLETVRDNLAWACERAGVDASTCVADAPAGRPA
jgi:hypothetical protein